MKFKDFKYQRINFETIEETFKPLLKELENAKDSVTFNKAFNKINEFRNHITTQTVLCSIRHDINTNDEFYTKENDYWDEILPKVQLFDNLFYKICLAYPRRDELNIPDTFFKIAEFSLKSFDEKIIEELQLENKLTSEYTKLKAGALIELDGKTYNLSSLGPKLSGTDRDVRKRAYKAVNDYFEKHEADYDRVYDELVKVRDRMAKKLGYANYVEMGYMRMQRIGYDKNMVAKLRKQVLEDIVPIVSDIYEAQRVRLGLDKLMEYDRSLTFLSGNPTPKGSKDELVAKALNMYKEMSPETGSFFEMMVNHDLFDLESKDGKNTGGYCTDIPDYKVPFIYANFNGTAGDVDVLTHEAGHAFQAYMTARSNTIPECAFPTMETAEIHSMSMEFFAYPWIEDFFKEDSIKYRYKHISGTLKFLPYGVLVDHFQHEVYENPEMSIADRKATWKKLEAMYEPFINYEADDFAAKGTFWYRQGHIFQSPFYYIDYCIAQLCALQFFNRSLIKDEGTWEDYLTICRNGGTKNFLENVADAHLDSPFEEGSIAKIIGNIVSELNKYDVSKY